MARRKRRVASKKRKRRASSGASLGMDKYPEELQAVITAASITSWASTLIQVPLLNLPERAGKARVLEFVKIQTNDAIQSGSNAPVVWTMGSVNYGNGQTTTTVPVSQALSDRRNFINGRAAASVDEMIELTDQAGNGLLYPAQSIYINAVGSTATGAVNFRIFYRIKYVGLNEYIGIMNQYLVTVV